MKMKLLAKLALSLLFLPLIALAQPSKVEYNWNNARFGTTSANAVQYKLARVYYNAQHWGMYGSIKFTLRPDYHSGGEIEYTVFTHPGNAYIVCTKATGANTRLGVFRMILGPQTSTGTSYSSQVNYYREVILQVDNYAMCRVEADVSCYYHAFDKLSITSGEFQYLSLLTDASGAATDNFAFDEKKIGFGHVGPTAKFHIFKSTNTDSDITLGIDGSSNSERAIGFYDAGTLAWWFGRDNNNAAGLNDGIGFNKPGVGTVLAMKDNGQVAIGTGTPLSADAILSVKGMIAAQKVKVTQTGWADFVFEKDYRLPTLQELEHYIGMHKHLPEIPSAAEVEKEGIDLGEMNKKLLQKIEELTLHLIEQNKRLEALEKANAATKKK